MYWCVSCGTDKSIMYYTCQSTFYIVMYQRVMVDRIENSLNITFNSFETTQKNLSSPQIANYMPISLHNPCFMLNCFDYSFCIFALDESNYNNHLHNIRCIVFNQFLEKISKRQSDSLFSTATWLEGVHVATIVCILQIDVWNINYSLLYYWIITVIWLYWHVICLVVLAQLLFHVAICMMIACI